MLWKRQRTRRTWFSNQSAGFAPELESFDGDIGEPKDINWMLNMLEIQLTYHIADIRVGVVNHGVFERLQEVLLEHEMGQFLLLQETHC